MSIIQTLESSSSPSLNYFHQHSRVQTVVHVESELSQVLHSTGSYDAASKLEYVVAEQNQMEYKLSLASVYHSGKFFFYKRLNGPYKIFMVFSQISLLGLQELEVLIFTRSCQMACDDLAKSNKCHQGEYEKKKLVYPFGQVQYLVFHKLLS